MGIEKFMMILWWVKGVVFVVFILIFRILENNLMYLNEMIMLFLCMGGMIFGRFKKKCNVLVYVCIINIILI